MLGDDFEDAFIAELEKSTEATEQKVSAKATEQMRLVVSGKPKKAKTRTRRPKKLQTCVLPVAAVAQLSLLLLRDGRPSAQQQL